MSFKYIEVVDKSTEKVITRFDVSNKSLKYIEGVERGININLNHDDFHTQVTEGDKQLPTGDIEE